MEDYGYHNLLDHKSLKRRCISSKINEILILYGISKIIIGFSLRSPRHRGEFQSSWGTCDRGLKQGRECDFEKFLIDKGNLSKFPK